VVDKVKVLQEIKELLKNVEGVNSVRIGQESTIATKDFPAIRILRGKSTRIETHEDLSFFVYIAITTSKDTIDIEDGYILLSIIEMEVINLLERSDISTGVIVYNGTEDDLDFIKGRKAVAIEFSIKGLYFDI
jgi:hypothetical protein